MVMHAIARWGCTDTVRKSVLEIDAGEKIPCRTLDSPILHVHFQSDAVPTELSPLCLSLNENKADRNDGGHNYDTPSF